MRHHVVAVTFAVAAWLPASTRADEATFAVIGYLPDYQVADVVPERLAPITDLVYFGLEPPADGRLSDSPVKRSVLRKLRQIKRVAGCRLAISVGGWNRSRSTPDGRCKVFLTSAPNSINCPTMSRETASKQSPH